jgi:hypothetical protein
MFNIKLRGYVKDVESGMSVLLRGIFTGMCGG